MSLTIVPTTRTIAHITHDDKTATRHDERGGITRDRRVGAPRPVCATPDVNGGQRPRPAHRCRGQAVPVDIFGGVPAADRRLILGEHATASVDRDTPPRVAARQTRDLAAADVNVGVIDDVPGPHPRASATSRVLRPEHVPRGVDGDALGDVPAGDDDQRRRGVDRRGRPSN
jgi:hypothetical protein